VLATASVGCGDPLSDPARLEESRILGVRMQVDDGSATLRPGAAAEFQVLIAGQDGTPAARFEYQLCVAAESDRGVPQCEEEPFVEAIVDLGDTPIGFTVPEDVEVGARVVLLGVVCLESEPVLRGEPLGWACTGREAPLRLSFDSRVADDEDANSHPDLSEIEVRVDGDRVVIDSATFDEPCAEAATRVRRSSGHALEISLGSGARERGEALQISHFASRGSLERQFSFVPPGDTPTVALNWDEEDAAAEVRLALVVRDGVGGVSWVNTGFCLE
jgi:hypothetical protein